MTGSRNHTQVVNRQPPKAEVRFDIRPVHLRSVMEKVAVVQVHLSEILF